MSRFQSIDHAPDQSNWHVGFNKYLIDRIFLYLGSRSKYLCNHVEGC
jgi:hypothetical protein